MRYFIGFLVTIGLIILLLVLLFSGGGKPKTATTPKTLTSYATSDAQVSLTIDGPVNAEQTHKQSQIIVDNGQATFEQLQGYNGQVINSQSYNNTEASFFVFLRALEVANFTKGDNSPSLSDERGICPLGTRYIVQLTQDGKDIERYWTTSCGGGSKTYEGNLALTLSLFEAQIPNYGAVSTQSAQ